LPFLSALAPSERNAAERGKRHKKLTDWAWQLLLLVRRWWPEREIAGQHLCQSQASSHPSPPLHRPHRRTPGGRILSCFVMLWQMEATFQEARRRLRVETQRQCSALAIRRTTLLGLFSLVTLFAHRPMARACKLSVGRFGTAQIPPELLRCAGAGAQGVVGASDFSSVGPRNGRGKSPAGFRRAPNRGALLCRMNG